MENTKKSVYVFVTKKNKNKTNHVFLYTKIF